MPGVIHDHRSATHPFGVGSPPGAGIDGLCGYHAAESAPRWLTVAKT